MDEIGVLRDLHPAQSFDGGRAREAARESLMAAMAAERAKTRIHWRWGLMRSPRRRGFVLAAGLAFVFLAVAVPAFGLPQQVIDFFSAPAAPAPAQESFSSLDIGAPAGMAPGVSGDARSVLDTTIDGVDVHLWVAPTASGGFCVLLETYGGGCDRSRALQVNPSLAAHTPTSPIVLFGDVLPAATDHLRLTFANGDGASIPVVHVSNPIDAAFFVYEVPASDRAPADWPVTLDVVGSDGTKLATDEVQGLVMREH